MGESARAARRAAAIAAGAGLCALVPLSLPTALAAKDTIAAATPAASVEVPVTPHARHGERPPKAEAPPAPPAALPAAPSPPPAPSEASGAGRGHHAHGGEAPPAGQPGAPSGGSRHGGEAPPAHGRRHAGAGAGTSGASGATGAGGAEGAAAGAVATGDTAKQGAESLARKQKKTGGGGEKGGGKKRKEREREREREKEVSPPVETEGSNGQGTGTSGTKGKPTTGTSGATPTALAATAAASTPAPTAATGPASLATPAPGTTPAQGLASGGARAGHAGRPHNHARKTGGRRSTATTSTALAAPALALAASTTAGGSSSGGGTHPRSGVGGSYKHSSEPAIVHTITRIVGVVPAPVRILIAALAALALALGLRSLISGIRTRRLVRQRGELLADVGLLQAALLPDPPARIGPVGTSVAYRPADGPGAGGDFYDVFALEQGQLAVIVGDVSGHGRDALPHTALIRFTVRAYLEAGLDPGKALQTAGTVLERQLGGSFATVLAAVYHPRERTLTYAAAGHPPPLVLGEPGGSNTASAIAPVTVGSAPPLGAGMRTGIRQSVVAVPGPARLCLHTDGVTEARVGEELFGEERLARSLAQLPADASASDLLDSVAAQSSARPDDMAACLLYVHGGAGEPAIVGERLELARDGFDEGRVRRFLDECGVDTATVVASVERARQELAHASTAMLELSYEGTAPVVTVHGENVIRAAALSAAGASR